MSSLANYEITTKLGKGSFGDVFAGKDKKTGDSVAIKQEQEGKKHILKHEHEIYSIVASKSDKIAIPKIYWFGYNDKGCATLVMQQLGKSIEYLHKKSGGRFRLKTAMMITIQIFDQLKRLHDTGFVHRDIKPENFLMGLPDTDDSNRVFMIDLGLAKRFKTEKMVHIKLSTGRSLIGTARYASIASHLGEELARKDDMESLFYMFIYFVKGSLPWQGITTPVKEDKYKLIGKKKRETTVEELTKDLPQELNEFLTTVRGMRFKERPDYKKLRCILTDTFTKMGYTYDCDWEWIGSN